MQQQQEFHSSRMSRVERLIICALQQQQCPKITLIAASQGKHGPGKAVRRIDQIICCTTRHVKHGLPGRSAAPWSCFFASARLLRRMAMLCREPSSVCRRRCSRLVISLRARTLCSRSTFPVGVSATAFLDSRRSAMAPCTRCRSRRSDATLAAPRTTFGCSIFGTRPPRVTTHSAWQTCACKHHNMSLQICTLHASLGQPIGNMCSGGITLSQCCTTGSSDAVTRDDGALPTHHQSKSRTFSWSSREETAAQQGLL